MTKWNKTTVCYSQWYFRNDRSGAWKMLMPSLQLPKSLARHFTCPKKEESEGGLLDGAVPLIIWWYSHGSWGYILACGFTTWFFHSHIVYVLMIPIASSSMVGWLYFALGLMRFTLELHTSSVISPAMFVIHLKNDWLTSNICWPHASFTATDLWIGLAGLRRMQNAAICPAKRFRQEEVYT